MDGKNIVRKWSTLFLSILFVVLSVLNFERIDAVSHSASDTLRPFLIQTVILILLLLIVYYFINKIITLHHGS